MTAAPTRTPSALYLPLVVREHCDPERKRADVVVALDTSSSMEGDKLQAARDAALIFVGLLDLSPTGDQVAVVRFDADAELLVGLGVDADGIRSAVEGLQTRVGTHIDAGLLTSLAELQGSRHRPSNLGVIALLTDGVHTGAVGADRAAADDVRQAGVTLYTIGLGEDVDSSALAEMAGDPARYFQAPDSTALAEVYAQIARTIVCPLPGGGFFGQRR